MRICIPVNEDQGLVSAVCDHFGSTPFFMIVDTESLECHAIPNKNQHHAHGMCQPLLALRGESIDGMVVRGIGMGALQRLSAASLRVFLAELGTVEEIVVAFKHGLLKEMTPAMACGGHAHGPCGSQAP